MIEIESHDFMCNCDDESRARAEAAYAEAIERLGCGQDDFLTHVVHSLEWGLSDEGRRNRWAQITGIAADQWCGVASILFELEIGEEPKEIDHAFIQCDKVEHGVAATWLYYANKYIDDGDRVQNLDSA